MFKGCIFPHKIHLMTNQLTCSALCFGFENTVLIYWYHSYEKKLTKVINCRRTDERDKERISCQWNECPTFGTLPSCHSWHSYAGFIFFYLTLLNPTYINGYSRTLKARAALYLPAKVKGKKGGGVIERLILASVSQGKGQTAGPKILIVEGDLVYI